MITFPPEKKVFNLLNAFLNDFINPYETNEKFWAGAFNQSFDVGFLSTFWERNQTDENWIGSFINRRPNIDPRVIATILVLQGKMDLPDNFKLVTLCKHIGLEVNNDKAHSALYDTRLCRKLFYELFDRL